MSQDALPSSPASVDRDPEPRRFQFTGSLLESSFYVERAADRRLREALLEGRYCHILAPRQIGKSSLRVRTARALAERGVRCASIDLTAVGTAASEEEWFFGLADEIARRLRVEDPVAFWEQRRTVAPARRLGDYLRHLLKTELGGQRVVVFLDEIEAIRLVRFGLEDFFLAIRALYEERSGDVDLQRLTFCLIGVTTPNDLVKNKVVTPFNVSEAVSLDDFTRSELDALAPGLAPHGEQASALLDEVYAWTDGHPYMTLRACAVLAARERVASGTARSAVSEAVRREFLERPLEDPNLNYAARRFEDPLFERPGAMLTDKILLYRSLLLGEEIPADTESAVQMELRLCGMVKDARTPAGRKLKLRNRVFRTALDMEWLKSKGERRFIAEAVWKWIESGHDEDALLRGVVLQDALRLAKTAPLSDDEREFLDASQRRETVELDLKRAIIQTEVTQVELELAKISEDKARVEREKEQAEAERVALEVQIDEVRRGKAEAEEERKKTEESMHSWKRKQLRLGLAMSIVLIALLLAVVGVAIRLGETSTQLSKEKCKLEKELARSRDYTTWLDSTQIEIDWHRTELEKQQSNIKRLHDEEAKSREQIKANSELIDRLARQRDELQATLAKYKCEIEALRAERALRGMRFLEKEKAEERLAKTLAQCQR